MQVITDHSIQQASHSASVIWAIASAQYAQQNELLRDTIIAELISQLDLFALNARRAIERLPKGEPIELDTPRWKWEPTNDMPVVTMFDRALNHIIHAASLEIGFEKLPDQLSVIYGGASIIPYFHAETDQHKKAFIDPFALSHAYFYKVLPRFQSELGVSEEA